MSMIQRHPLVGLVPPEWLLTERRVLENHRLIVAIHPRACRPGHLVMFPKRPCRSLQDVEEEDMMAMGLTIVVIKRALRLVTGFQSYFFLIRSGVRAGQVLNQLHMEIVPSMAAQPSLEISGDPAHEGNNGCDRTLSEPSVTKLVQVLQHAMGLPESLGGSHVICDAGRVVVELVEHPRSEGHFRISPKAPSPDLEDCFPDDVAGCLKDLPRLVRGIQEATGQADFFVVLENGTNAGQETPHLSVQCIPCPDRKKAVEITLAEGEVVSEESAQKLSEGLRAVVGKEIVLSNAAVCKPSHPWRELDMARTLQTQEVSQFAASLGGTLRRRLSHETGSTTMMSQRGAGNSSPFSLSGGTSFSKLRVASFSTMTNSNGTGNEAGSDISWSSSKERVRRIRARKLRAFASNEISGHNLRSLFRLLDDDGSGEISPDEIRRGLLLLGLEGVSDPVALSRIVCDIDDDKTGTITEGEFLAFFSQHSISSLKSLLDGYALDHTHILASSYGTLANGDHAMNSTDIPSEDFRAWFKTTTATDKRIWLDLVGYKADTFQMLADVLKLHVSCLLEALTFKLPSIQVLSSNRCVQITVHHMTLSDRPLDGEDSKKVLGGKGNVQNLAISLEQTTILVINDKVLITLRCPFKAYRREDVQKVVLEGGNPFKDDESGVQKLYDSIRERMSQLTPDVEHLFSKGTSAMSLVLLDAILTGNYDASDEMQDWEEILTSAVRSRYSSALTVHLEGIQRITSTFEMHLAPLVEELSLERFPMPAPTLDVQDAGLDGVAEEEEAPGAEAEDEGQAAGQHWNILKSRVNKGTILKNRLKNALAETLIKESESDQLTEGLPAPGSTEESRPGGRFAALGQFLIKEPVEFTLDSVYNDEDRVEFEELAEDMKALIAALQAKRARIEQLTKLLAFIKTDMMNRTLYALTLITAVATPITFLTGLWGMNFQDMDELNPETGGTGYKVFWIALACVVSIISMIIGRLRLFEALF